MPDAPAFPTIVSAVVFAAALGFAFALVCVKLLPGSAARPAQVNPLAAELGEVIDTQARRRVEALEAAFPEWRLAMAKLADEAEGLFVDTERKRRQVQATQARIDKARAGEAAEDAPGDDIAQDHALPFKLTGDRGLDKARVRQLRLRGGAQ